MIIAIDGPSGAGKSTLGKMLAKELGLLYLDTGAMYRAAALAVKHRGIDTQDTQAVADAVADVSIEMSGGPDDLRIILNGRDVSSAIRTQEAARAASVVSANSRVRQIMVDHQRRIGLSSPSGCVLEGRDIGSVVFPNADHKFFLTAEPGSRAMRRFQEDRAKGRSSSYEETLAEINERDRRDVSRSDSPLTIPEDAEVIDTSELDLQEVLERMLAAVRSAAA